MSGVNDNAEIWDKCESCGKMLRLGDCIFEYSECRVCADCAPTWEQASKGFEIEAFEHPDNWRNFRERLHYHLANGGKITDHCTEVWHL